MDTIGPEDASDRLKQLTGWRLEGNAISRKFIFEGFADAIAFIVRIGFEAEAADHHPDILLNYKRVTLTYTTHSAGGLTAKDFAGAARATAVATAAGGR